MPTPTAALPKAPKAAPKTPEALAKSHATPADTLRSLFESRSTVHDRFTNTRRDAKPVVMAAIAQNPNTPLDILVALLPAYPAAFCKNPVAPLVLLEKPDFLTTVEPSAQLALLRCVDAPAPLVRTIAAGAARFSDADRFIADEARQHIAFAGELDTDTWPQTLTTVCREFCTTASADEKQFVADYHELGLLPWAEAVHPLPQRYDATLGAALIGKTEDDNGAGALMRSFSFETTPQEAGALASLHIPIISLALAAFDATPTSVLPMVAHQAVRHSFLAASHPNAGEGLVSHLAAHPSPVVRRMARQHPAAPASAEETSRQAILNSNSAASPFWYLITGLGLKLELVDIRPRPHSRHWMIRLSAVFALTNGKTRLTAERREMLVGLSHDANRFVRAAAKTTLADPAFRFAW